MSLTKYMQLTNHGHANGHSNSHACSHAAAFNVPNLEPEMRHALLDSRVSGRYTACSHTAASSTPIPVLLLIQDGAGDALCPAGL